VSKGKREVTETDGKGGVRLARWGRVLAILVVLFGTTAQIGAIALGDGGNYWPFLRYPMYSRAGASTFAHRELCVIVEGVPHSLSSLDLGIPRFRFFGRLASASRDTPAGERARDNFASLVGRYYGPDVHIELWQADFRMTESGLEDASPPWRIVKEWVGVGVDDLTAPAVRLPTPHLDGEPVGSGQCEVGSR
jgi:hypothetical protein